ncbi:hypothetical protein RAA17_12970 [Komagataeibacter rhaeticus]|nr:hypothetical protein [Komagataeibacter rhaeticus]
MPGQPGPARVPAADACPLGTLAPLFHTTPDELATRLTHAGYSVRSTDETLEELATAAGQRPNDVLIRLLPQHAGHRH